MKTLMLSLLVATALGGAVQAQTPPAASTPAPAVAPAQIREPPSNLQMGLDADRFIGDPARSVTRISRDAIMTRKILTAGDPSQPGPDGAVLRYRKEVVLGAIQPGESSTLSSVPEQQIIYVTHGEGRLDDGGKAWDLKPGYAILIPPGATHRLSSVGGDPLEMIMMSTASPPTPAGGEILVRDTAKILYIEQGVHWTNMSKSPFSDLGERFLIVYMGPMTIAGAHAHTPETEEGWVKITDGQTFMQVGSEIRRWPAGMGLLSPNNSQTVHAAINTSDTVESWFYFQGRPASPPQAPTNGPRPALGGRIWTPQIAQSAIDATVASHPLSAAAPAKRR
jgi:mannose-6-phosphate isomerase-like protein (cupin superfamily)